MIIQTGTKQLLSGQLSPVTSKVGENHIMSSNMGDIFPFHLFQFLGLREAYRPDPSLLLYSLPLVVGKYFVRGWFSYVFPYHETGLLKWLPANEGCPAKSEVLLVGFWASVYFDNLAVSKGTLW